MGKKGFNAKARQVVKTSVDNSKINEIKLDFGLSEYGSSDASNLLALPSKKRETKIVKDKKEKIRILSKAQRKRLEKIVDKKHKKANRAALLESLSKCQASQDEVKHMTAISTVQTLGLKKLSDLNVEKVVQESDVPDKNKKYSSIAGAKKRLRLLKLESTNAPKKRKYDPNVVGLEESSSEESESSADEDDEPEIINDVTSKIDEQKNEKDETEINTEKYVTSEVIKENNNVELIKDSQSEEPRKEQKVEKKPLLTHEAKPVQVTRDPKIQVARLKLPILGEEQRIMEAINENEIVIIAGETGSGKTTQIPQFLYEAGYTEHKMIGITEPRRVAAVAMSQRVAQELGLAGAEVGYLMRFEGNVTKDTKIKFMTDGVLLKEIQSDFLLSKYSVIIIDEAHERSVYTDILLGLLSRIVPVRRKRGSPLRLIIMSATLRVEDFTENTTLFKQPPPVIKVESRQFPVTVHFNRRTNSDYLKEAFRKTVKIHTRLPDGGILIFVTGQQEVHYLVRKLKAAFPYKQDVDYSKMAANKTTPGDTALDSEPDDIQSDDDEVEKEMKRARKARRKARVKSKLPKLPKVNLDDFDLPDDDGHADLLERDADSDGHLSDSEEEEEDAPLSASIRACRQPLWVLPLYSMLDSRQQARVFRPPPPGARLCVVSTDVAETSLTIPAVHYVVDTGKKKMRVYDGLTGASAYRVVWTAKAAAEQRAGRAGRTAPGHVYRLYSSAVYQHECPAVYPPDLCRRPVDDLLLTLKCMGVDKVVNFPFPTAPDRLQLRLAERRLETLGILERPPFAPTRRRGEEEVLKVTPLGKAVSAFPLLPRYGKMLALSHQHDLLPYTIALVAALSVPELLSGSSELWPATGQLQLLGDAGVLLRAVGAAELARYNADDAFCAKHGLREKAVTEIRKIRRQLTSEINLCVAGVSLCVDPRLPPPTDAQARLLRQLLLSGLADQVARKISLADVPEGEDRRKYKYAYQCSQISEPIFLHSGSLLRRVIPEWVVYQELYESGGEEKKKLVMRTVAAVEPEWLPVYVPQLCNLGEPLEEPPPRYDAASGRVRCHFSGTFGKQGWPLPCVEIDYPDTVDRYRWFARFLLEGAVVARLRRYSGSLLSPASTMVKSWSRLQPRAQGVLQALTTHAVGNKQLLLDRWTTDPQFLLEEYLSWLPQSAHNEVSLFWPPRD